MKFSYFLVFCIVLIQCCSQNKNDNSCSNGKISQSFHSEGINSCEALRKIKSIDLNFSYTKTHLKDNYWEFYTLIWGCIVSSKRGWRVHVLTGKLEKINEDYPYGL